MFCEPRSCCQGRSAVGAPTGCFLKQDFLCTLAFELSCALLTFIFMWSIRFTAVSYSLCMCNIYIYIFLKIGAWAHNPEIESLPTPAELARRPSYSLFIFIFLKILFIYSWETQRERERERQRHRQREKQAPCREPDVGLDPQTPGSRPGPKAVLNCWATQGSPALSFDVLDKAQIYFCQVNTKYLFLVISSLVFSWCRICENIRSFELFISG